MTQYEFELNNTLPNQTFSTTLNNIDLEIILKLAGSGDNPIMQFALKSGDEYICPYVNCFANQGLLPYPYMVSEVGGNFFFSTDDGEYPNYKNYNTTCVLYFISEDELNG